MAAVDVETTIEINRPRAQVAAFTIEPDNATRWYVNIASSEMRTERPLAVGSQIEFVARFLGRRLAYTYEVREFEPDRKFVMSTAQGPFPMETTYLFEDAGDGTRVTLRNRGEPSGFATIDAPVMAAAMRGANRKDLQRLKSILENTTDSA